LPQKQKSSAPGVEIGQRHFWSDNSYNEQQCPLWIGSEMPLADLDAGRR